MTGADKYNVYIGSANHFNDIVSDTNKNIAVLFLNVWNVAFTTTTYSVPITVTSQIITGLTPNGSYTVNITPNGNNVTMTITNGGSAVADAGGVLVIGNTAINTLVNFTSC